MLDTTTKRRIDTARKILVGRVPDPKSQVEQITDGLGTARPSNTGAYNIKYGIHIAP